jgi:MYXO-CTERM domain-containing protein
MAAWRFPWYFWTMVRSGGLPTAWLAMVAAGLTVPVPAQGQAVCRTVEEFNAAMESSGVPSADVTVTFDVTGVNPHDFFNGKGSLAHLRYSGCEAGEDATIKVYGVSDPPNTAHPGGTLKLEYNNLCCGGSCDERWADPNPSLAIFLDGSEHCHVTTWVKPDSVGYRLACGAQTHEATGGNPDHNVVNEVALLAYLLPGGGVTWEMPNATATNAEVCYVPGVAAPDAGGTCSVQSAISVGSVSPTVGTGQGQTFRVSYDNCFGAHAFRIVQILVGDQVAAGGPAVHAGFESGLLGLGGGTCPPGANATLSETWGSLDCASSSATASGNRLTLDWALRFNAATFSGDHKVFVDAKGPAANGTEARLGWQEVAHYTVVAVLDGGVGRDADWGADRAGDPRDAGARRDAGSADSSSSPVMDAAPGPAVDAGGSGGEVTVGCGCSASTERAFTGWALLLGMAGVVLGRRRRT